MPLRCLRFGLLPVALATWISLQPALAHAIEGIPQWTSQQGFRVLLSVDPRGRVRSNSPASVELDFAALLRPSRLFDANTVEVVAYDGQGRPKSKN